MKIPNRSKGMKQAPDAIENTKTELITLRKHKINEQQCRKPKQNNKHKYLPTECGYKLICYNCFSINLYVHTNVYVFELVRASTNVLSVR